MIMSNLSPEEIQRIHKVWRRWEEEEHAHVSAKLEKLIRDGLKRMIASQQREVTELDRKVDRAIAAVHRSRTRHPAELARMPWITD